MTSSLSSFPPNPIHHRVQSISPLKYLLNLELLSKSTVNMLVRVSHLHQEIPVLVSLYQLTPTLFLSSPH